MSKLNNGGAVCLRFGLRDWFAGMALIPLRDQIGGENEEIAKYAYEIADAMLAAREADDEQ